MADEMTDVEKARRELLWGLYIDLRLHARHAETLRSNVISFMIVIASVLIAAIAADGHILPADVLLCAGVACAALIGFAFAASYTELYERNRLRALEIRNELDDQFFTGDTTIAALLAKADDPHRAGALHRWSRGMTGSTKRFWLLIPALLFIIGVVMAFIAI